MMSIDDEGEGEQEADLNVRTFLIIAKFCPYIVVMYFKKKLFDFEYRFQIIEKISNLNRLNLHLYQFLLK